MFRKNRKDFVKGGHYVYGIVPYPSIRRDGWPDNMPSEKCHAMSLKHGLVLLGPDFMCERCVACKGTSRGRDGYGCEYCAGTGLTQGGGDAPAFDSQRHQVLHAASLSLLLPGPVRII